MAFTIDDVSSSADIFSFSGRSTSVSTTLVSSAIFASAALSFKEDFIGLALLCSLLSISRLLALQRADLLSSPVFPVFIWCRFSPLTPSDMLKLLSEEQPDSMLLVLEVGVLLAATPEAGDSVALLAFFSSSAIWLDTASWLASRWDGLGSTAAGGDWTFFSSGYSGEDDLMFLMVRSDLVCVWGSSGVTEASVANELLSPDSNTEDLVHGLWCLCLGLSTSVLDDAVSSMLLLVMHDTGSWILSVFSTTSSVQSGLDSTSCVATVVSSDVTGFSLEHFSFLELESSSSASSGISASEASSCSYSMTVSTLSPSAAVGQISSELHDFTHSSSSVSIRSIDFLSDSTFLDTRQGRFLSEILSCPAVTLLASSPKTSVVSVPLWHLFFGDCKVSFSSGSFNKDNAALLGSWVGDWAISRSSSLCLAILQGRFRRLCFSGRPFSEIHSSFVLHVFSTFITSVWSAMSEVEASSVLHIFSVSISRSMDFRSSSLALAIRHGNLRNCFSPSSCCIGTVMVTHFSLQFCSTEESWHSAEIFDNSRGGSKLTSTASSFCTSISFSLHVGELSAAFFFFACFLGCIVAADFLLFESFAWAACFSWSATLSSSTLSDTSFSWIPWNISPSGWPSLDQSDNLPGAAGWPAWQVTSQAAVCWSELLCAGGLNMLPPVNGALSGNLSPLLVLSKSSIFSFFLLFFFFFVCSFSAFPELLESSLLSFPFSFFFFFFFFFFLATASLEFKAWFSSGTPSSWDGLMERLTAVTAWISFTLAWWVSLAVFLPHNLIWNFKAWVLTKFFPHWLHLCVCSADPSCLTFIGLLLPRSFLGDFSRLSWLREWNKDLW